MAGIVVAISEAQVARCLKLATTAYGLRAGEERELFLAAARRLPNQAFRHVSSNDIVRGLLTSIRGVVVEPAEGT